jgi:hypothetical protein
MSLDVEQSDCPCPLPLECEEVYYLPVESETRKKFSQLSARVEKLEAGAPTPSGFKDQPKWIVIPVIGGVVTLLISVLGTLLTVAWFFASGGTSIKSDIAAIKSQVSSLADDVRLLKDHAMKSQLKLGTDVLGADPLAGSRYLSDVANVAKRDKVSVNPQLLVEPTEQVLRIASSGPTASAAWQAALDLVSYRSFLNEIDAPLDKDYRMLNETDPNWRISWDLDGDRTKVRLFVSGGAVPGGRAAIYDRIGQEVSISRGPARFTLTGPGIAHIDGLHLKNVIFKNIHIRYSGGPIILENVYFVNCTFDAAPSDKSRLLVSEIVKSAGVSLKIG